MEKGPTRTAKQLKKDKASSKIMLALPPADPSLSTEGEVVSSFAIVSDLAKKIEQVGNGYAKLQGKFLRSKQRQQIAEGKGEDKRGRKMVVEDSEDEESPEEEVVNAEDAKGAEEYEKKRKKKTKADIEREALLMGDLYAILGLEDVSYEASAAAIGKAYKKAALVFHPDKLGDALTEKDREVWLQIQNAYETLTDPAKRKKYDSSLPFDDKIPAEDGVTDKNFFEVFQKCFNRNARFSTIKPVPALGTPDDDIDEVRKFYKFWDYFKTWREFSQYDEYDTEEAQDRYEKRWMEKQNRSGRKKYEKEERKRLIKLTDRAYKLDPRIRAEEAREAAAKEAGKKAKKEQKQMFWREQEEKKQQAEDAARKLKEGAEAKEAGEKETKKAAQKKYRETVKEVIQLCITKMPGSRYDKFFLAEFTKKFGQQERIDELLAELQALNGKAADSAAFEAGFAELVQKSETAHEGEEREKRERRVEEEKQAKGSLTKDDWSTEEMALLTKGITKFPAGTGSRWKVIADFVGSKGLKQVIAKAKQIQESHMKQQEEKKQLEVDKKEHLEKLRKEAAAAAKKKEQAPSKAVAVQPVVDPEAWTSDQQKQMENGMRTVPATVATKERWIKIAEGVDGRTAKECFGRFKELCAKAKATPAAK